MINSLAFDVNLLSQQHIELCYHCHKCAAGCPVIGAMDYGPDRLLRLAALDQEDSILSSRDIWLCAGCYTCATHCPNEIDIAAVMDALRQLAVTRGYLVGERDALLFHQLFLGVVQRLGRSHEAIMLGLFKILSHVPITNDMIAGMNLFVRGKVPLLPHGMGAAAEVQRIFKKIN